MPPRMASLGNHAVKLRINGETAKGFPQNFWLFDGKSVNLQQNMGARAPSPANDADRDVRAPPNKAEGYGRKKDLRHRAAMAAELA